MTTEEILAAARAEKKPEPPAADPTAGGPAPAADGAPQRRKLTAADILAIANGKLSIRREQQVLGEPAAPKAELPDAGDAKPDSLPSKIDRTKLTAADIRALGGKR